jgi:hypothetical protein
VFGASFSGFGVSLIGFGLNVMGLLSSPALLLFLASLGIVLSVR